MTRFDSEFNSASYSSGYRINTGMWANVSNEYQLENPKNSVFWTKPLVLLRSPTLKMQPFDRQFKSAYYWSGFRINTGIWANVSNEHQLENPKNSVFRTNSLGFVRWPTLKIPPFDREFKSSYYSSGSRINTGIWANVSSEYPRENPKTQCFGRNP